MKEIEFIQLLQVNLSEQTQIISRNGGVKVVLPFSDYAGDPVEILVDLHDNCVSVNDLGHVAGILFTLDQHTEHTPAHQLVKNLAETYHITMDYDQGVLRQDIDIQNGTEDIFNFFKVLIALQTVIPELRQQKKKGIGRSRLAVRLGKEIKPLKLPHHSIQKQVEIPGKHLNWVINYKYPLKRGEDWIDVLVVATDLGFKDPLAKAEHVITLATDLSELNGRKDLRIVYEVQDNEIYSDAWRAAGLIEGSKDKLNYKVYNFANQKQHGDLLSLTVQELLPLTRLKN
jgi:hypothetical protein